MTTAADDIRRIEETIAHFSGIYLDGIPHVITDQTAFLSFILMVSATDALAGFRYDATIPDPGARFSAFVRKYFPAEYHPFATDGRLWKLRCHLVHAFSPKGFALIHRQSGAHLHIASTTGKPILNAEDFYAALVTASQNYFREVRADAELRALFIARLEDPKYGGSIAVGPTWLKAE